MPTEARAGNPTRSKHTQSAYNMPRHAWDSNRDWDWNWD